MLRSQPENVVVPQRQIDQDQNRQANDQESTPARYWLNLPAHRVLSAWLIWIWLPDAALSVVVRRRNRRPWTMIVSTLQFGFWGTRRYYNILQTKVLRFWYDRPSYDLYSAMCSLQLRIISGITVCMRCIPKKLQYVVDEMTHIWTLREYKYYCSGRYNVLGTYQKSPFFRYSRVQSATVQRRPHIPLRGVFPDVRIYVHY